MKRFTLVSLAMLVVLFTVAMMGCGDQKPASNEPQIETTTPQKETRPTNSVELPGNE